MDTREPQGLAATDLDLDSADVAVRDRRALWQDRMQPRLIHTHTRRRRQRREHDSTQLRYYSHKGARVSTQPSPPELIRPD